MSNITIKPIKSVITKKKKKCKTVDLDIRQIEFLKNYLDPKSGTFGNAKQSAIKVGYSKKYADNITSLMPEWLSENIGELLDDERLRKAEQNLDEFLGLNCIEDKVGVFGPIKDPETKKRIKITNVNKLKVKADITKFVAETIGKEKYSKKAEITGNLTIGDLMKQNEKERKS